MALFENEVGSTIVVVGTETGVSDVSTLTTSWLLGTTTGSGVDVGTTSADEVVVGTTGASLLETWWKIPPVAGTAVLSAVGA